MRFVWAVLAALLLAPLGSAGSVEVVAFLADGPDGALGDGILKLDLPEGNASSRLIISDAAPVVFVGNETIRDGTHLWGSLFLTVYPSPSAVFDGALEATVKVGDDIVHVAAANVTFDPQAPDPDALLAEAAALASMVSPGDPEGSAERVNQTLWHELAEVVESMDAAKMTIDFGYIQEEVPEGSGVTVELRLVNEDDGGLLPGDVGSGGGILEMMYDGENAASALHLPWWTADPDPEPKQRNYGSSGSGGSGGGGGGSGGSGGGSSGSSTDSAGGDGDVGDGNMTEGDGNETGGKDSPGLPILGAVVVLGTVAWIARRRFQ